MSALPGELLPDFVSDAYHGTAAVDAGLARLGLRREDLYVAVRKGVEERGLVTEFDPSTADGLRDWMARVRELRRLYHRKGWTPENRANAPFMVSPDGDVYVGVMQGNEHTGNPDGRLESYHEIGSVNANLTAHNDLVGMAIPGIDEYLGLGKAEVAKTWFVVTRYEEDKTGERRVHLEVSQPAPTSQGQKITSWAKRLCLEPIGFKPVVRVDTPAREGALVTVEMR
ncbi:hypothetical protein SAMN05421504_115137 [Amycolatopsis xylanica]|uniref:Uncharacterized protein n=1 Tax=Amycolatopsis xylanica TaxID=589385 RepID=A0A1H3SV12_9PSEU|nr:hypothetical protein [Amycolatopsis xylanica]SDZ41488.1 hypothetical protein SAMN05421504_115137 [Amycolatopsis xylanica]